ncbi:MAG: glycosyl hydrolase 53 family protein [Alphaproteobacteria bacterium]|nr:glycosyl hydrolase 53 family protein [Alphaproteobacteria bacterium]
MRQIRIPTLGVAALALIATTASARDLYFGADLSFANQMADCGAVYHDTDGTARDVYTIFRNHGANLVRVRLWTDGNKTGYSNLADVEKTLAAARARGMHTLLDFHYADSWADGGKQPIPSAWAGITDDTKLAATLYQYTYYVLTTLAAQGLMPQMVQVGNEINPEMLQRSTAGFVKNGVAEKPKINWTRDAMLINAGIRAVHDAAKASGTAPHIMLQIAQPENVESWFADATKAGVTGYDMIGISYYGYQWSKLDLAQTGDTIRRLRATYPDKDVMLVETAYPWSLDPPGMHSNLSAKALMPGHPATPDGQRKFLADLTRTVLDAGGDGVNYWAPDLVANQCGTRNKGSTTALFDFQGNVLPGIDFMRAGTGG